MGVAALIALTVPVAVLAGLVLGHNIGCLTLATSAFYVLSYELLGTWPITSRLRG